MLGFRKRGLAVGGMIVLAGLAGGCGGGSSHPAAGVKGAAKASGQPSTTFRIANVAGVGNVLVDGSGRTVYILESGGKNVPCTDSNGCTQVWPDLPLPKGTTAAKAEMGAQASLLKAKKLGDGETYPTYNGWLVYEYTGDSGSGQANGEGIKSFGGTWYVLNASGNPVTSASGGSSGGGGSAY